MIMKKIFSIHLGFELIRPSLFLPMYKHRYASSSIMKINNLCKNSTNNRAVSHMKRINCGKF